MPRSEYMQVTKPIVRKCSRFPVGFIPGFQVTKTKLRPSPLNAGPVQVQAQIDFSCGPSPRFNDFQSKSIQSRDFGIFWILFMAKPIS